MALCLPEALTYRRARRAVERAQRELLLRLLQRNASGEFGRAHGFATIRSAEEYQRRVPLARYEDYQPAIERVAAGETGVLTAEPALLLEPTSGSTAATKLIPYTAALRAEFQRGIAPWVVDLYRRQPALMRGQAYWSVSPVARGERRTAGGLPIGFEDDSAYLGGAQRRLLQALLAVPGQVRLIDDMDSFRYTTLLFLLRSRELRLISVWNPTFLTLLVAPLRDWWRRLAEDIAAGRLSPPQPLDPRLAGQLLPLNRADPRRAAELERIFLEQHEPAQLHAHLWPRLGLISCWGDAQAALYLPKLARGFPQARIQPKGLLATEAFVTLPLAGGDPALALRSHFFEFFPVDGPTQETRAELERSEQAVHSSPVSQSAQYHLYEGDRRPLLAHQLEQGQRYAVVVSTGGGLYRYQLGDIVEVTGYEDGCPRLRFCGRGEAVADHFGEKLDERQVGAALGDALRALDIQPAFVMLACQAYPEGHAYTLYVEAPEVPDQGLAELARRLEQRLRLAFHYDYCRRLGQLGQLRAFRVERGGLERYMAACQAQGQRAGNIKPVALHRRAGWGEVFEGRPVEG